MTTRNKQTKSDTEWSLEAMTLSSIVVPAAAEVAGKPYGVWCKEHMHKKPDSFQALFSFTWITYST
jgi:hypothetical protein